MIYTASDLHARVDQCMRVDQHRLRRRVRELASRPDDDPQLITWLGRIERSVQRRAQRLAAVPTPVYPDELPVVQQRTDILAAIDAHQVVIVCGETGSGKTTQLPKMCLELGRGVAGFIGHTQPRRIAARSVASRIASELGGKVGESVGFKVRFSDQVGERSHIKLMTDGILLAEIQSDPWLSQYDTLIIDEAHERSLNVDFLLGYLRELLPRRPDLKVIVTSATLDPERFSRHFNNAPIVQAEGRTYPVEVRYQPPEEAQDDSGDEQELPGAVVQACEQLLAERQHDVLVFLSGEREIREQMELLQKHAASSRALRGAEIVPLFSRLSNAEQNRIFAPHSQPRIVLATNVAETSLTVPGIRAVVDAGRARISRYSVRSQVQRLPIERVSQASANQRKGRCGREAAGVCIRLYCEADFESRPEFTEPEIQRTSLASVILQMATLKLGRIDDFPFIDTPEPRFINDGYRTLQELGALDDKRNLTPLGRRLARLPLDPRLARMLLAAGDEGCVNELLTIVAALSVQDPRDRPFDKRQAADERHAEFFDEKSDFMAWLNLWAFVSVQRQALSNSKFRKMCQQRFLSPLRIIEWMETRRQLANLGRELKLVPNTTEAGFERIHRALLSGLLANVATFTEQREYLGTRNRHLSIFPGSGLFRKGPKWIMAGEIAETTRVYARQVAQIQPEWIERLAAHLLQRSYRDAHWQKKRGVVGAFEQSSLYGLVIYPKKRVNYGPINPAEARQIFIREALVGGELVTRAAFLQHNLKRLEEVEAMEDKSRRRDILVDEQTLVRFYDAVVPEGIYTAADFETWRRGFEREQPRGLYFSRDLLLADAADEVDTRAFPEQMEFGGMVLPLSYHFAPGEPDDGVTLNCPVALLNRVPKARGDWLVHGMLEEKLTLMIKALPKHLRRNFVPAPDYARAALQALAFGEGSLVGALSRELARMSGLELKRSDWDLAGLPVHLQLRIQVTGSDGQVLAAGRDLVELQTRFADQVEQSLISFSDDSIECDQVSDWNFGDLPEAIDIEKGGVTLQGYPALQVKVGDTGGRGVGIKLFASPEAAAAAMPVGVRALCAHVLREEIRYLQRKLPGIDVLALRFTPFGSKSELISDIIDAALDHVLVDRERLPRTRDAFYAALERRGEIVPVAHGLCDTLGQIFEQHRQVSRRLASSVSLSWVEAAADIRQQISALLYPGFVSATGVTRLARLPVYFEAMERRLLAIDQAPDKDRRRRAEFLPVWEAFGQLPGTQPEDPGYEALWQGLRWSFEELRVSLFAQKLGATEKVSVSRLENRVAALRQRL